MLRVKAPGLLYYPPVPHTLRDWLAEEPFSLALSAGFFGFFAHAGFVAALEEAELRPARTFGSSAGALVAGLWSSGRSARDLRERFFALKREDFWDPAPGAGLLRGGLFRGILEAELGARTFDACRIPFAASAFDVRGATTRVLSAGDLAPAIQASCSFPGLFHPVWIDGRPYLDGGIADRSGLRGVPAGARVLYHHLESTTPGKRWLGRLMPRPQRPAMATVHVAGLPSLGPFRLERGRDAFEHSRRTLLARLHTTLDVP